MSRRLSPAILAALLIGRPEGGHEADPVKAARRRSHRRSRGSMRKATRRMWNAKENERRARQVERGITQPTGSDS